MRLNVLPPQLKTCNVLYMTGDVEWMSTPARGWCGVHRGPGGSGDPHVSPLQGPLSALSVPIDSARPPWLGAPGGQFPLQGKQQPLVPGASTWGVGSKAGAEEGPQEEDPGVLAAKPIPEPGRDDQTGLLLHPSALSSPPPKVSTASFIANIVYNIQKITSVSLTTRGEILERWKRIWPQVFHLSPPLPLG